MTPDLAAKAREIVRALPLATFGDYKRALRSILSALTEADAAATERAAKIAEDEDGYFSQWGEDRNTRVARQTCKDAAAAIRNQEKPDADA